MSSICDSYRKLAKTIPCQTAPEGLDHSLLDSKPLIATEVSRDADAFRTTCRRRVPFKGAVHALLRIVAREAIHCYVKGLRHILLQHALVLLAEGANLQYRIISEVILANRYSRIHRDFHRDTIAPGALKSN